MNIINVACPTFKTAESYGRLAGEIAGHLAGMGYHVNRIGGAGLVDGARFFPATGGLVMGYPTLFPGFGGLVNAGPKLALTMFESTQIPSEWIEPLNACNRIVVPARWLVEVFRQSGVESPVEVAPLGISNTFMVPKLRRFTTPFTFLAIGDRGYRKGWWHALRAFTNAFGKDTRYRLIIKARGGHADALAGISNPNIEVITDEYTDAQMLDLYHRSHVMVFPTCAEGFGFPPREFAATGGVALATDFGGTADDIEHWGIPIPYTLSEAWLNHHDWDEKKGQLGLWAEPDVDALADLMHHVASHYDEAYAPFGLRAAGYCLSHYTWKRTTQIIDRAWKKVLDDASHTRRETAVPA